MARRRCGTPQDTSQQFVRSWTESRKRMIRTPTCGGGQKWPLSARVCCCWEHLLADFIADQFRKTSEEHEHFLSRIPSLPDMPSPASGRRRFHQKKKNTDFFVLLCLPASFLTFGKVNPGPPQTDIFWGGRGPHLSPSFSSAPGPLRLTFFWGGGGGVQITTLHVPVPQLFVGKRPGVRRFGRAPREPLSPSTSLASTPLDGLCPTEHPSLWSSSGEVHGAFHGLVRILTHIGWRGLCSRNLHAVPLPS